MTDRQDLKQGKSTLRVTPCILATSDHVRSLGREPNQLEREQSLLVEWSKIPDILFKINFPESLLSLHNPVKSFNYVRELQWETHGSGGWKFDALLKTSPYAEVPASAPYPARIRGWITPAEDHLDLRLQLINESQQLIKPQSLFVCTGQNLPTTAKRVITADYFMRNGKFLPWRTQEENFEFASASIAALTEKGWQQCKWFESRGQKPPVKPHPPADGVRAGLIDLGKRQFVVALVSDDAIVLGGKSSNPCQDLSLGFGPLEPGASAQMQATWWFIEGGLDDLLAHLKVRKT